MSTVAAFPVQTHFRSESIRQVNLQWALLKTSDGSKLHHVKRASPPTKGKEQNKTELLQTHTSTGVRAGMGWENHGKGTSTSDGWDRYSWLPIPRPSSDLITLPQCFVRDGQPFRRRGAGNWRGFGLVLEGQLLFSRRGCCAWGRCGRSGSQDRSGSGAKAQRCSFYVKYCSFWHIFHMGILLTSVTCILNLISMRNKKVFHPRRVNLQSFVRTLKFLN